MLASERSPISALLAVHPEFGQLKRHSDGTSGREAASCWRIRACLGLPSSKPAPSSSYWSFFLSSAAISREAISASGLRDGSASRFLLFARRCFLQSRFQGCIWLVLWGRPPRSSFF